MTVYTYAVDQLTNAFIFGTQQRKR